jgi:hypothetical protein
MVKVVTPAVNAYTEPLFVVSIYGDKQVKGEGRTRRDHETPKGE